MAVPWLATGLVDGKVLWSSAGHLGFTSLVAQEASKKNLTPDDYWTLIWHYLPFLGFVLVAILVLYILIWWRKRAARRSSASDQLTEFRTLYEQGEITREEFDQLRGLLGDKMKKELGSRLAGGIKPLPRPLEEPPAKPDAPEPGIKPD